jgi:hypothetical protein
VGELRQCSCLLAGDYRNREGAVDDVQPHHVDRLTAETVYKHRTTHHAKKTMVNGQVVQSSKN